MKTLLTFLIIPMAFYLPSASAQNMSVTKLDKIISEEADSVARNGNSWMIKYKGAHLYIVTDENNNRMRIIAPITKMEEVEEKHLIKALEANFHTALDIKYAISEGVMWSIFVHPLKELSENQVKDAISQVYSGASTFGYTYSSGDLFFPGN